MLKYLLPFSWLYGLVIQIRNWCYDRGIFKIERVGVPVISVGNMTAGGTGKTQMVEYLVRYITTKGKRVAVLSRGYKRTSAGMVVIAPGEPDRGNAELLGDEPFQLARKFSEITVIVDAKRTRSAKVATETYKAEVLLLDDGFQHRALARDVDIVMVSGKEPLNTIPLLPSGLRREPMSGLKRAYVVAGDSERRESYPCPLQVQVETVPVYLHQVVGDERIELGSIKGKKCIAFCGIANPERFRKTVSSLGAVLKEMLEFPDHHSFTDADIVQIQQVDEKHQPDFILTTEKDFVRLLPGKKAGTILGDRLYYVAVELRITHRESEMHKLIDSIITTVH